MKRVLLAVALLLSLGATPPVKKFDTRASVIEIHNSKSFCSAFSIDKDKGLYITAAHCIEDNLMMQTSIVKPLAHNDEADLAIIQSNIHLPAIPLGDPPPLGSKVTAIGQLDGYPFTYTVPLTIYGVKISPEHGYMFVFTGKDQVIEGMSGGPIVDEKGKAVSVTLCYIDGHERYSCGVFYPDLAKAYAYAATLSK